MAVWLAIQACLAGFLLYPAITVAVAYRRQPDPVWLTVSVWSAACAVWILVSAALLWPDTPPEMLGPLLSARHVMIVVSVALLLATLHLLTGRVPLILAAVTLALFLIRAVLFFTTDLIWTHTFTADGQAIYGPWRNPFTLLLLFPVTAIVVYAASGRRWRSQLARRAVRYAILPGVALWVVSATIPGIVGEYAGTMAVVPIVLAIQWLYFGEFRRQQQRIKLVAAREARLAAFGTDILASPTVPQLGAVNLIEDVLYASCAYVPVEDRDDTIVSDRSTPDEDVRVWAEALSDIVIPVRVAGMTVAHLRVGVSDPDDDDRAFVMAVAAILAAGLERTRAEAMLRHSALADPLTGLPTWALLQDRLARLLRRPEDMPVALLCCDLVALKEVNDDFGHDAGDEVLRTVAARLASRIGSRGTVARIGGDQFVVVQPRATAPGAEQLATDLVDLVGDPIRVAGNTIRARLRVGITVAAKADRSQDRLVRDAEMAVMRAKSEDLAIAAYDAGLRAELVGHRRLVRDLQHALAAGDIRVAYQPIVDLRTMRVAALEALARWRRPDGVTIPPDVFVPMAEEIGAIGELGAQVLQRAVSQLASWSAEHPAMQDVRLSVNVAASQLSDPALAVQVQALLNAFGVAPSRLTMEVTESGLLQSDDQTGAHLRRLREIGIGLSLDDFGTGYSTLARLMAFPVTELKIDAQFTRAAAGTAREIVPAIVGLAHASGLGVVAEGIETPAQCQLVVGEGCDFGQGYLFDAPLAPEHVPTRFGRLVGAVPGSAEGESLPAQRPSSPSPS